MSSTGTPWYKAARAAVEGRRCGHCKKNKAQAWSRGLCRKCYLDPAVRARTVPLAEGAPLSAPVPAETTACPPGSPEKVAVMEDRVRRGEQPFHPADASWDVDRPAVAPTGRRQKTPSYSRSPQETPLPPTPKGVRVDPRALAIARHLLDRGPQPIAALAEFAGLTTRQTTRLLIRHLPNAPASCENRTGETKSPRRCTPNALAAAGGAARRHLFVVEHAVPRNLWHASLYAAELVLALGAEGGGE